MSLTQGIPTPWEKLTASLSGGLLNGEVYAIGASTGHGKTSLGLQFTIAALRASFGVLIFSLEMDWRSVMRRMVAIEARVDLNVFREAQMSGNGTDKAMRTALAHYTAEFIDMPLAVSRKGRVTPKYIVEESRRLKNKLPKLDLIIVDHLQLMSPDERKISEYEKFTSISRALKQSAVELNVPVLVMSQTTRGHAQDHREELELCDLRGSGAIEEDLAGCLLVYPDKKDEKTAKEETYPRFAKGPIKCWAKLAKNRYGESDVYFPLNHFKACTRFDPYDENWRTGGMYAV
jgi:replicative DNA helicase